MIFGRGVAKKRLIISDIINTNFPTKDSAS